MKEYELLSGEIIRLSDISLEEQEHISTIEELIATSEDYFEIYRQAFAPLMVGKYFDVQRLQQLQTSPRYKVLSDLVTRYHNKLFSIGF